MRHGKKINHLGRKSAHRKAMLSNLAISLIEHKRINTTLAKAKALRVFVEPILTKAKVDSTHSRRTVFGYLQNKDAVSELFREISPKITDRSGGYTRIIRTGNRLGDNAEMCLIELVDFNELLLAGKTEKKTNKKRSRRGGSKVKSEQLVETNNDDSIEEAVVVEESQEAVDTTDSNVEEEKNEDSNIESSTEEGVTDSSEEEDKSEDK